MGAGSLFLPIARISTIQPEPAPTNGIMPLACAIR
jgi:hypothetical protein